MAYYVTREIKVTAVDTATAMTKCGSEGTLNNVQVPAGCSKIAQIIAAAASDGAVVGSAGFMLRLKGAGLTQGQQNIAIGAMGGTLATTNHAAMPAMVLDVDIPVVANGVITMEAECVETDTGSIVAIATLVFA